MTPSPRAMADAVRKMKGADFKRSFPSMRQSEIDHMLAALEHAAQALERIELPPGKERE